MFQALSPKALVSLWIAGFISYELYAECHDLWMDQYST